MWLFINLDWNNFKICQKCAFVSNLDILTLIFFSYNVSVKNLLLTDKMINKLKSFPYPNHSKSLYRFLGMMSFCLFF